jgi:hypothetical protein
MAMAKKKDQRSSPGEQPALKGYALKMDEQRRGITRSTPVLVEQKPEPKQQWVETGPGYRFTSRGKMNPVRSEDAIKWMYHTRKNTL